MESIEDTDKEDAEANPGFEHPAEIFEHSDNFRFDTGHVEDFRKNL